MKIFIATIFQMNDYTTRLELLTLVHVWGQFLVLFQLYLLYTGLLVEAMPV